jgi:hypothetical protein
MSVASLSPLTIVGHEENTNLREVTWNQRFLDGEALRHNLRHGQAVVYTNVARSKVRLVAVFYGMAVLLLPPVDEASRVSLYLQINAFLRKFQAHKEVAAFLDAEIVEARERLKRSEERKKLAASAARKRKSAT